MLLNHLTEIWSRDKPVLSAWLSSDSAYQAEVLGQLPYDAVTVDLQHGMLDFGRALSALQAISATPAIPLVRVPGNESAIIQKVLDAGAAGLICPMINSAAEAHQFVQAVRYPPLGQRSYGPARGLLVQGPDYVAQANEKILALAMIETAEALAELEAILATPGLDGVFIGPMDLSVSLLGQMEFPPPTEVQEKIDWVIQTTLAAGRRVGIFCADPVFAREMRKRGCHLIALMQDIALVRRAAQEVISIYEQD